MSTRILDFPCANGDAQGAAQIYRKISLRLIPLLFICYVAAYLDRMNVGFARLQMQAALQFDDSVYGLGAGIFFVGYFLFEVPANAVLHRMGARKWISTIMVVWGALSMATACASSPFSFYLLRFLLGAAEAGFFPGVIVYLGSWYPAHRRGHAVSLFLCAIPFAGIVGGPASGWILQQMHGVGGGQGWQWLFVLQGLPSVLLGLVVRRLLHDRVEGVAWLSAAERQFVLAEIARDVRGKTVGGLRQALADPRVWRLAAVYFALTGGLYAVSFWLPAIIQAAGVADALQVGLLSAMPWSAALVAMLWVARRADRRGSHASCCLAGALAGATGLAVCAASAGELVPALLGLTIALAGILAALPVFWALPTGFLGGGGAAAGVALINSFGNLAGFGSPYLLGVLHRQTQGHAAGLFVTASLVVCGVAVLSSMRRPPDPAA